MEEGQAESYTLDEKLKIVRAAAELYGKARAKVLWQEFGLPDCERNPQIVRLDEFVRDMLEPTPGGVVFARAMYKAYLTWCESKKCAPVSEKAFGISLPHNGVVKLQKRVREYIDVQLRGSDASLDASPDLFSAVNSAAWN